MYMAYTHHASLTPDLFEELSELISDGEFPQIDFALRTLIFLIEKIEDENLGKDLNLVLPGILSAILSAFTNEEIGTHGRE